MVKEFIYTTLIISKKRGELKNSPKNKLNFSTQDEKTIQPNYRLWQVMELYFLKL